MSTPIYDDDDDLLANISCVRFGGQRAMGLQVGHHALGLTRAESLRLVRAVLSFWRIDASSLPEPNEVSA